MDECGGAFAWDLVASTDGATWEHIHKVGYDDVTKVCRSDLPEEMFHPNGNLDSFQRQFERAVQSEPLGVHGVRPEHRYDPQEELQDYLDAHARQTWALTPSPTEFYRFFRITPPAEYEPDDCSCFHAVGFEFYGDVHEE